MFLSPPSTPERRSLKFRYVPLLFKIRTYTKLLFSYVKGSTSLSVLSYTVYRLFQTTVIFSEVFPLHTLGYGSLHILNSVFGVCPAIVSYWTHLY